VDSVLLVTPLVGPKKMNDGHVVRLHVDTGCRSFFKELLYSPCSRSFIVKGILKAVTGSVVELFTPAFIAVFSLTSLQEMPVQFRPGPLMKILHIVIQALSNVFPSIKAVTGSVVK
jgi:hypothetical protein